MGYRGKLQEQAEARVLRAQGLTLGEIAASLGVAKSSVSLWVRDVEFEPRPRQRARRREPNALQRRKAAEIDRFLEEGRQRIGRISQRDLLIAGIALYAGDGSKTDGDVRFATNDPDLVRLFCRWLRQFFDIDESRLRVQLYLHQHLDLEGAVAYWSAVTDIPRSQFIKPYRAAADSTLRKAKHVHGCAHVRYSCSTTHRAIVGLLTGLVRTVR
jgi:transcriptional regulator with XRE-family HTH domain